jgi:WhiB family transcriptional regulator, redox-sensing transcriptional regulator
LFWGELVVTQRVLTVSDVAGPVDSWRDVAWRASAVCSGADTEMFFPVGFTGPAVAEIRAAKALCGRCPVQDRCLRYALDTAQTAGIWGGYDEHERKAMRQRQRRSASRRRAMAGDRE